MNMEQFYESIDGSYENVCRRMMGNTVLVEKFVKKFMEDSTYQQLSDALEQMDYEGIFRSAHTLRGLSGTLEFSGLQRESEKLVNLIRENQLEAINVPAEELRQEYEKIASKIQELG